MFENSMKATKRACAVTFILSLAGLSVYARDHEAVIRTGRADSGPTDDQRFRRALVPLFGAVSNGAEQFFTQIAGAQPRTDIPRPIVPGLVGYTLAFDEEFNEPNVNTEIVNFGPIVPPVRWIAHTPYGGDFGAAYFGTGNGPIYSSANGYLDITAHWQPAWFHWYSGLLSSADTSRNGFSQALGYWEAKIWLPQLPGGNAPGTSGLWPAFWLDGVNGIGPHATNVGEIDIIEAYSSLGYHQYQAHWHVWNRAGYQVKSGGMTVYTHPDLSAGWRVYSCLITPLTTFWYFDGSVVFTAPTDSAMAEPMYVLVDLGMADPDNLSNSGIPDMKVQYIRCWAPRQIP